MKSELFDSVILIHGIRTEAKWAKPVGRIIKEKFGLDSTLLSYDFFDSLRFYCPIFTRNKPYKIVRESLCAYLIDKDPKRVLVIAHSFGTYLITRILKENPDIELGGLILCGSIVDKNYPWNEKYKQVVNKTVNERGDRDIWPVMAESVTWGYGASGTTGFNGIVNKNVEQRVHDIGHNDFFKKDFVEKYWVPLIRNWEFIDTEFEGEQVWWRGALTSSADYIIKPLVACLFGLFIYLFIYSFVWAIDQVYLLVPETLEVPSISEAVKKEIFNESSKFKSVDGELKQIDMTGKFEFTVKPLTPAENKGIDEGRFKSYNSYGEIRSTQQYKPDLYITANIKYLKPINSDPCRSNIPSIEIKGCHVHFMLQKNGFSFWNDTDKNNGYESEFVSFDSLKSIGINIHDENTIAIRQIGNKVTAYLANTQSITPIANYVIVDNKAGSCNPAISFKTNRRTGQKYELSAIQMYEFKNNSLMCSFPIIANTNFCQ